MRYLFLLLGFILTNIHFAEAQQAKLVRIGWLGVAVPGTGIELFRRELRNVGHFEGKDIVIEARFANNKLDQLSVLADELVRLKVDLLVVPSTPGALAAKNATRTTPIIFLASGDPVTAGLVDSLPRPGGNITGFTTVGSVLAGKRLDLLKESVMNLSRVAVLWDSRDPTTAQQWKESQLPARELGLQLYSMEVSKADKYEEAFKEATKAESAALSVTHSAGFASNRQRIAELAAKNRLPTIYARGDYVESGGMMSYGHDPVEPFRRAAVLVDKIIKAAKPAELPVEQPTKFELVINLKTAKQIGVTIPPNVLARADKVIK